MYAYMLEMYWWMFLYKEWKLFQESSMKRQNLFLFKIMQIIKAKDGFNK